MIEKQKIFEGDQQQLNTLLVTHFVAVDEEVCFVVEDSLRQKIAMMLLKLSTSPLAAQPVWNDAVATAIIEQCKKILGEIPVLLQAQLRFNIQVMAALPQFSVLDAALMPSILPLRIYFLAASLSSSSFFFEKSAFKQVFEMIYQSAIGWQPGFTKHSDAYIALINGWVAQIQQCPLNDKDGMQKILLQIQSELNQFNKRFTLLSARLVESESGLLKLAQVNDDIYLFFTQLLQDKQLPLSVSTFIQESMLPDVKLYLMEHGIDAPIWARCQKLLNLLVDFYQDTDAEPSATVKTLIARLPEVMKVACGELNITEALVEDFCNQVAFDFALLSGGKTLEDRVDVSLSFPVNSQLTAKSQVSAALIEEVAAHGVGQWFIAQADTDSHSRVQLSLKLEHCNQLLFTNFIGQKAFTKTLSEFAYMLSAELAKPLTVQSIIDQSLEQVLNQLLAGFMAIHAEKDAKRKEVLLQKKQQQEMEAKQKAAVKAKEEAEAFRKRKVAEQQRIDNEKAVGDLRKEVRLSFDTLALGGWIEILKEDGSAYYRAKLAVKFSATGRFVFVDQDGATVIESQRDALIERVMEKNIRLLDSSDSFAERLNKVVQTMHG